jgi:hypothetical protein
MPLAIEPESSVDSMGVAAFLVCLGVEEELESCAVKIRGNEIVRTAT